MAYFLALKVPWKNKFNGRNATCAICIFFLKNGEKLLPMCEMSMIFSKINSGLLNI